MSFDRLSYKTTITKQKYMEIFPYMQTGVYIFQYTAIFAWTMYGYTSIHIKTI